MCRCREIEVKTYFQFDGYEHGIEDDSMAWWMAVTDINGILFIDRFVETFWASTEIAHMRTLQLIGSNVNGERYIDGYG